MEGPTAARRRNIVKILRGVGGEFWKIAFASVAYSIAEAVCDETVSAVSNWVLPGSPIPGEFELWLDCHIDFLGGCK